MRPLSRTPLDCELRSLKREIQRSAARLRAASRALRREAPAPPALRVLRGGLWRRRP